MSAFILIIFFIRDIIIEFAGKIENNYKSFIGAIRLFLSIIYKD
ncbi:hypothetical protein DCCM_4061 [Desulfocucumis palustris]|uniref:Uncharacterized protein n=1 Tax=Desulfocucumis palustris TaxID=1898651 RepID=A0A2L2XLV4_9FIRM|nr:hypothetical protein DCCM_4061 [Desulfocucumis palustris]